MPYYPLNRGEQQSGGISPHASTHHVGKTDALSAEAIGARPAGVDIDWGEIGNPPNFASIYRAIANPVPWGDISDKPAFASRWPNWDEVTNKPLAASFGASGSGLDLNNGGISWSLTLSGSTYTYRVLTAMTGDPAIIFEVTKTGSNPARIVGISQTEANTNFSYGTGWSQYSASYLAQYRRLDKFVKLQGLVRRTTTSGTVIATLPVGFRPNSTRLFGCQSSQGYTRVDVNTNGQILLSTPNPAAAITWISLDQIDFLAT